MTGRGHNTTAQGRGREGRVRLLDLFCGAGGCTKGYQMAGFDVDGVDINPQPRYIGSKFTQADALEYLSQIIDSGEIEQYDAIHASPPCQAYTKAKAIRGNPHPDLIEPVRRLLQDSKLPYIIENVPGSPLVGFIRLTGQMFNLKVERERWFECSFSMPFHLLPAPRRQVKMGRPVSDGDIIQVVGNFSGASYARQAMGIGWMSKKELSQAIPPAYTEYIGRQLMAILAHNGHNELDS